jgi:hypothetical protein
MKTILCEPIDHVAPSGFAVFTGTSAHKIAIGLRKLERVHNLTDAADSLPIMAVDAAGITTSFHVPMTDSSLDDINLKVNEIVAAVMPDSESRQKAERDGKLWPMEPDWHRQPGAAKDDLGTGGNARGGRGLAALNENTLRKKTRRYIRDCGEYRRQRLLIDEGNEKVAKGMAIIVVVCVSLLGGFGTGTLRTLLRIIREESLDLKVPVRIIVLGMTKGSIEPVDAQVAARNQSMALRELNTALVGGYRDADHDPRISQPICDSVLLISNANSYGEFNELDRLIALGAQYVFHLFHTALGRAILEKAVDIEESWPEDDLGGRRCASTMSLSKIHLDLPRAIMATGNMLLHAFLHRLMLNKQEPTAAKEANLLSVEKELAETETIALASERLYRLSDYRGADAREYAVASFQQRSGQRGGYKHCCDLDNASSYALEVEAPRRLKPQILREAQKFISEFSNAVDNKLRNLLTRPDGIRMASQFLDALAAETARFAGANRRKLDVAQSKKKAIDDLLGRGHEMLDRLKKRFWLFRALSLSTKREIIRIIPPSTESAIRNRLEITARLSLANEVYPAVQEYLAQQQAEIHRLINNVTTVMTDIGGEADRLRTIEPILTVPLGHEIVDSAFIDRRYGKIVEIEGGIESILEKIFAEFSGRYKNLLAFNHVAPDQIKETLLEYCLGMGHRCLGTLRVGDVFRESCRSAAEIKDRIGQSIHESRGRLRLVGEADQIIPTMKFIGTGDRATGEWIVGEANGIDDSGGDWQLIETGDPYTIVFYQQRARISLTRMIADTDCLWQVPDAAQDRVKLGSDPILALAPQPDCSMQEIFACIGMGLICGVLRRSDAGYELVAPAQDAVLLGDDLDEVVTSLRKDYDRLVTLYSSFAAYLARQNEAQDKPGGRNGRRARELDAIPPAFAEDAIACVQEVTAALKPYLRRQPLGQRPLARPPSKMMENRGDCDESQVDAA